MRALDATCSQDVAQVRKRLFEVLVAFTLDLALIGCLAMLAVDLVHDLSPGDNLMRGVSGTVFLHCGASEHLSTYLSKWSKVHTCDTAKEPT